MGIVKSKSQQETNPYCKTNPDQQTQNSDDLFFVEVESPSDYLKSLYDRLWLLQVQIPRKFRKGRATNHPTDEWLAVNKKLDTFDTFFSS